MGTLSKAIGAYGGYLCASRAVIDLMRTRARTFIYSTGLPPPVVAAAIAALDMIERDQAYVAEPLRKASLFTRSLNLPEAQSAIVPVVIGEQRCGLAASRSAGRERLSGGRASARRPCRPARRDCALHSPPSIPTPKLSGSPTSCGAASRGVRDRNLHHRHRHRCGQNLRCGFADRAFPPDGPHRSRRSSRWSAASTRRRPPTAIRACCLRRSACPVTPDSIERISPWRFRAPLSPDMAARREGRSIDVDDVMAFCQSAIEQRRDILLIEGVGGIMVPLDERAHHSGRDDGAAAAAHSGGRQLSRHHQPHAHGARLARSAAT